MLGTGGETHQIHVNTTRISENVLKKTKNDCIARFFSQKRNLGIFKVFKSFNYSKNSDTQLPLWVNTACLQVKLKGFKT